MKIIESLYTNFIAFDSFIELWFWVGILATAGLVAMCCIGRRERSNRE